MRESSNLPLPSTPQKESIENTASVAGWELNQLFRGRNFRNALHEKNIRKTSNVQISLFLVVLQPSKPRCELVRHIVCGLGNDTKPGEFVTNPCCTLAGDSQTIRQAVP